MFSLMQASSLGTRKRGLIIVTLAISALLTACGGGTPRKKTAVGDAPSFNDCVVQAALVADAQLAEANTPDGALLYDSWYTLLEVAGPTTPQPLWATRNDTSVQKNADETWRCKNCHGWDYNGKLGFPSLLAARSDALATPEGIFCAIKTGTGTVGEHIFGDKLADATGATQEAKDVHIWNLTKFIVDANGIINIGSYIASNGGIFNANRQGGKDAYTPSCSGCHGADGAKYADDGAGLGFIALDDPWEMMHKIRFGDPQTVDRLTMPAFQDVHGGALTLAQVADIIAWAQGNPNATPPDGLKGGSSPIVPVGTPGSGSSSGGGSSGGGTVPTASGKFLGALIYDSIAGALNKTLTGGNPLWDALKASPTPTTDTGTWRCKNCHGWDYKGVEGVNAGGFAAVGGPANLLTAQTKDAAQLKAVIKTGYVNNTTLGAQTFHAFGRDAVTGAGLTNGANAVGPGLSDVEIDAIVDFIKNGMIETSTYIGSRGGAFGDPAVGATMFANAATTKSGSCSNSACHGTDGKAKDFDDGDPATTTPPNEFVGTIAVDNPWEFFHKARWGQPGSQPEMRGTVEAGITDASIADLLRFAQTLPTQ